MPNKKETDEHLLSIEFLLANLLLDREPSIKQVAKIMGIRESKLREMLGKEKVKSGK